MFGCRALELVVLAGRATALGSMAACGAVAVLDIRWAPGLLHADTESLARPCRQL